jgi:hypothetical protein
MSPKRLISIAIGLLVVIIVGSLLIFGQGSKETTIRKPISQIPNDGTRRVFIKDFHTYEDKINLKLQDQIETTLYGHAAQEAPDLYTGVIREGSLKESLAYSPAGNTFVKKILVDVEPIKMTYVVEVRQQGSYNYVNISCAPPSEQLIASSQCKNLELLWD